MYYVDISIDIDIHATINLDDIIMNVNVNIHVTVDFRNFIVFSWAETLAH